MKNDETYFLDINELKANSRFAKLLPSDLAHRYHAVPVAGNGNKITVAMADPSDAEAREAILTTMGHSTCLVRGNAQAIDNLLSEFWDEVDFTSPSLLYWSPINSMAAEIESYAQSLATLLNIRLDHFETPETGNQAYLELISEVEQNMVDIVILCGIEEPGLRSQIKRLSAFNLVDRFPVSLLVVQKLRWPLSSILLILRNEASDESAIDWTVRIAQPSSAEVAILPLTFTPPAKNDQYPSSRSSIATMLTTNCSLGKKLRLVAHRLVDSEINGTIVLRHEIPFRQIRFELMEKNYDLVVIASELHNQRCSRVPEELIKPLLSCTERPVLITKPTIHLARQ